MHTQRTFICQFSTHSRQNNTCHNRTLHEKAGQNDTLKTEQRYRLFLMVIMEDWIWKTECAAAWLKLIVCFRQTQTHTLPPSNNIPNFISSVYQSLSTSLLPSPLFSSYPLSFLLSPSFSLFLHPSTDLRADRSLRRGVRHLVAGHKPRLLLGVCRLIRVLLSVIMRSEPAAIGV